MAAFDGIRFVITHSVADGSLLAGRGHITGVHTGPFGGIPATGAAIDVETVDVVRLGEDGRVTERWGGLDRFALLTQLGVLPARP
jgi:predicted ester cyclase